MKNKNTFRKWMALFLSISMVAASGITSNVRLRAAEDTPVQETTAEGTTSADTDASASENADETTVANVDQNDTTRTEEIGLNGTEQAAEESAAPSEEENKNAETAAEAEQGTTPATVAESENKETVADSTASSSVSSSSEEEEKNLTASEQIDEARKDATKREYSYEDDLVSVTATLDDPKAVPDNAEFRVTPVTKDSTDYNYDAYMNALNDDAAASSDSDTEKQYTDENTLLYDMAFIYPVEEKDEDGNVTQKEVEVQPAEGAVKISVNFKKDQLTKSLDADKDSDVEIKHLPLTDAVKESNDTTADATNISADDVKVEDVKNADVSVGGQTAEFTTDNFSAFAIISNGQSTNTEITPGTAITSKDVLGNAWYYGITADTWHFNGEAETNFAVKTLTGVDNNGLTGGQTGVTDKAQGSNSARSMVGTINGYTKIKGRPEIITCPESEQGKLTPESEKNIKFETRSKESVEATVGRMISSVATKGSSMLSEDSISSYDKLPVGDTAGKITLDFSNSGDGTFYINLDKYIIPQYDWQGKYTPYKLSDTLANNGCLTIKKTSGQNVVFNTSSKDLTINKLDVIQDGQTYNTVDLANHSTADYRKLIESIYYNAPNAESVHLQDAAGIFLLPNATNVTVGGVAGGWLVANTVTTDCEWHFTNGELPDVFNESSVVLQAVKQVNGTSESVPDGFNFKLEEKQSDDKQSDDKWKEKQLITNNRSSIEFDELTYDNESKQQLTEYHIYRISEVGDNNDKVSVNGTTYNIDTNVYYAKVKVEKGSIGNNDNTKTWFAHATLEGYYTDEDCKTAITGTPVFNNTITQEKGSLKLTKTSVGHDTPADAEFTITGPNNFKQTVKYSELKNGSITLSNLAVGSYTVEESKADVTGYTLSVTGNKTATVSKDGAAEITLTNNYTQEKEKGSLKLTKTSVGHDTPADAEFTITGPNNFKQTVKYSELKNGSITLSNLAVGSYTVEESKADVTGYTLSVTGNATAEVVKDKTSEITLMNTYTQKKAASAVISGTKTLNGVPASVAGQFRFDLFDADGNRIDTAANDVNGNFIFGKLHFEKAGDYTYTIKEQNAGRTIQGIKYQAEAQNVTIHVGDDGDGVLKADVVNGSISFNNTQYGSIKISKDWDDKGNESYRPSSVVIDLIDTATGAVVKKLELSEVNGWSMSYDELEAGKSYTVHEEENDEFYKALNNDQVVTADVNGTLVDLTNKFIHKPVTVYANKVLNGGTLTNGEFMFALYRNSDPEKVYRTAANNAAGEIFFTDVEYDEKGYTVREIQGSDASVAYDSDAIEYDAEGNVTSSSHAVLTNTVRPIVLRVQKRSRTAPYDPLPGATYGLYEVVKGGNDILIESQVSDENGYMYFGKIQPSTDGNTHIYYFKEIAAPEGHEVDPYIGQKFQVRYTGNGEIALFSEDGQTPVTIGDITSQNAENLLVQHTSAKTTLDTAGALTYSDSKITATAQAADGAFEAGTTMKVEPLTGSELKDAQNKVEIACGKIASNVVYYNVEFVDKDGKVVEPKFGDVTVTIQYKDSLALPEGTDAKSLKIVHLKEKSDGTEVQAVAGSIAANSDKLLQASFTSDSFSKFGIVEPSADNSSLNSNYLVTAAGVSDQVSRLNIAKLDTSGKYLKGARLQIIEKATGRVMADWTTTDGPETFARWFDEAQTKSMNVDTYYILHEVSAPDGYQLADDILFRINKYDSSITIYKLDENGNLVADQEAIDKWVSDNTLDMIDVPVEYQTKKTRMQKTVKYEKVIQGKDKVVYVTNAKAVKTGDVSNLAMYILLFAAAGAVLIVLYFRRRDQRAHKS